MKPDPAHPIGVFDSGVGGLTVVRALMERLPFENITYFGDTARVPYGVKSVETITGYAATQSLPWPVKPSGTCRPFRFSMSSTPEHAGPPPKQEAEMWV
jgi:hypothetical protein